MRVNIRYAGIVFIILSLAVNSAAVTRNQAIDIALKSSAAARIATANAAALRASADQTTAFIKPQLTLNAGYVDITTDADEISFPPELAASGLSDFFAAPEKDISAEATITQALFAGGRILNSIKLKHVLIDQAGIEEAKGIRDVRKNVKNAFDMVLFQQANVDLLKDRVTQGAAERDDAHDLSDAGMVTSLDVRQAELKLTFAEDALQEGQTKLKEAVIDFNITLGRSLTDQTLMPEGDLMDSSRISDVQTALQGQLRKIDILDMKLVEKQLAASGLNKRITKGAYYPTLNAFSNVKHAGETTEEMDTTWSIGLRLEWPIASGGLTRAKNREAAAKLQQAKAAAEKVRQELGGAIKTVLMNIETLSQRIHLQQSAVALSEKNYADARGHYRAGTITLTRLGEFNLMYAEARFNLLRLHFQRRQVLNGAEGLLNR